MTGLLAVDRLVKRYPVGRRGRLAWAGLGPRRLLHAVDDVSFTLEHGEAVGLVGESGCGKSTLAMLLALLARPTGGSIRLGGRDVAAGLPGTQRGRIQMVFQDHGDSLDPRLTVFDAIAQPLIRLEGLTGAALRLRVEAALARVHLPPTLATRRPHQLSGGQVARVGIARAIAPGPEVLILDEPTAALDASLKVAILQLLDELRRDSGMAYLFVSHDLDIVRLLCGRVMVMYLGRIVESGQAEALFAAPAHPYTRGLLAAAPSIAPRAPVPRLPGEPPSPIDPPPGRCRFAGRCPVRQPRCEVEEPPLVKLVDGREVACHFPVAGQPIALRG